ncbi:hypothetical protein BD311DRAFT_812246 [Dichomitus squalens]|uniref:3-oxo-5-alpha-steroid 4-dehydrogenase C-terminal domain-containing protein n=1 Tax=Dichomitus squalens TaxID=114155 RepID=A0A4Q9M617_9APHY|nr:hypothetical protein BD311DRAFT_812246 [Dichomitus squalens]
MSKHVPGSSSVCIHSVCVALEHRRQKVGLGSFQEYVSRLSTSRNDSKPYALISPLHMPSRSHLMVATSAVFFNTFNTVNSSLMDTYLSLPPMQSFLADAYVRPTFWLGLALWKASDNGANNGKAKPKQEHYAIPHGLLYRFISYPNYFCEWGGVALVRAHRLTRTVVRVSWRIRGDGQPFVAAAAAPSASQACRPILRYVAGPMYPYTTSKVKHRKRTTRAQLKVPKGVYNHVTKLSASLRKTLATELDMTPCGVQAAYGFAMPHIVSDVSIGDPGVDDGPDRLKKFCQSMLNKPEFTQAFRALRLLDGVFACPETLWRHSGWGADFSPAGLLTKVLSAVVNLRVLHTCDAVPLFQSHPAVYEAVTKLDRLKVLLPYYIGNTCLKAISQIQSKVQIIKTRLWKDGPRPQGDVTPFRRRMLESFMGRHVLWDVHTLDIGGRIVKISELTRAFPNPRRLTCHMEFSVEQETGPVLQYAIGMRSGSQNDLKTLLLMKKTNLVMLSVTLSHTVSEVFLGPMKSLILSLRYMEMAVNDGACGHASMQWQTFKD